MIEGTPAITMTSPIQKPGAPDTLLRIRSAPARHLTDHQGRGRDNLFGSGRICGCHDHLQENAPNDGPTQDGETRELVVRPYTAIVGYAASSHRRGKLEKGFCATYVIHRNREAG